MSNKKINLRNIIKKSTILTGAMALSFGIIALNYNQEDPYFSKHRSNYNSDLAYIKDATVPANTTYITMTQAKTNAPTSGQKISISTFNELIDFSNLLNTEGKEAYLDYDYELIANIECDGSKDFNPIGYKQGKPFTGSFNGNGYEITNLQFSNDSKSMAYYSMFSVNEGEITNVGLTYPTLILSSPNDELKSNGGVSYLVGDNKGTVSNSFVIDEATNSDDSAGITAYECRISTLCVKNEGTLSNNYVAVDRVTDSQSTFAEFAEITLEGTASNCYYYNNSISMVVGNRTVYKPSANLADKPTSTGNYVLSKDDLKTALNAKGWKTSATYGSLSTYIPIPYGVQRGLAYNDETKTFTVSNDKDYAYMYELFNYDDYLASERITYKIAADIDLIYQPVESYTYTKGIGASIIGDSISGTTTLITNQKSNYPTIYNAKLMDEKRVAKSVGVDCYGLFNFVTGTIKNLNIYAGEVSLDNISTTSNNVKGIGILAGYIESAHIENVHVYGEITKENNSDIKEYYLGGVTGILGGAGVLTNVTAAGSFNIAAATNTIGTSAYMQGIAIGGIAGYLEDSFGHISDATSAVNIDTKLGSSSVTYAVGGIIGAGYTTNYNYVESGLNKTKLTGNLENVGNITVGATSGTSSYSNLYVSGIIGRHMGTTAQVSGFNNIGEIKAYVNANNTYVSGVENVDFNVSKSQFKNNAGKSIFYASSFTNGEEVKVLGNPTLENDNLKYTNVINIKAGNGLVSQLEGIYNLAYNEKYNNSGSKTKAAITAQAIDMNKVKNFAPVLNVVGGTANYTTTVSKIYNLRDLTFDTSNTVSTSTNFKYAGVALGQYISFEDVRNEGKLTFTLDNAITGNLIVAGLFEEVSSKMKATNIYNAGDIDVNYTANFTGNIYASGICYKNENGFTDTEIAKYNPSSDTYDNTLVGSINNAINKGSVKVSSTSFGGNSISYDYAWYLQAVGWVIEAIVPTTSYTGARLIGDIFTSGITYVNESVITNTFNLGDVKALNYITDKTTTRSVDAAGIAVINSGKYAFIENSANNGSILAANLSSYDYSNVLTTKATNEAGDTGGVAVKNNVDGTPTTYLSDVNAAGIVARNDRKEDGTVYTNNTSNSNSSQVISFTINYGEIFAYNLAENLSVASIETKTKAAGIIASGLCNVININNYGSVYSSETAAGIFGVVSLSNFATEVNQNTIHIANTLNYGNIKFLAHGYDNKHKVYEGIGNPTSNDLTYAEYSNFDNLANYASAVMNTNSKFKYFGGSIIGIIDFANNTNAGTNLVVRYLVSLNDLMKLSGAEINANSSNVDTTTIYSPYLNTDLLNGKDRDDFLATNVQYAPISSETIEAKFAKTNAHDSVAENMTFYGVFNESFTFRKVIEGKIADGDDSGYYNTTIHLTDRFLTDFFQFIPYTYVNANLMETIGWKTSAYLDAATRFATSLEGVYKFYQKYSTLTGNTYTTDLTAALSTTTWSSIANPEILMEITKKVVASEDTDGIIDYIEYIFSDTNSSIFTEKLRGDIVDYVYNKYPSLINSNRLIKFLNGYSSILASALCTTDNIVKQHIIDHITDYISGLNGVTKEELIKAYIDYLKDTGNNSLFENTTVTSKYDLLNNLFTTIDGTKDATFYATLFGLFSINSQTIINEADTTLSGYGAFMKLEASDKILFFTSVINANDETKIKKYLDKFANEIGFFDYLREDGYDISSFNDLQTNLSSQLVETNDAFEIKKFTFNTTSSVTAKRINNSTNNGTVNTSLSGVNYTASNNVADISGTLNINYNYYYNNYYPFTASSSKSANVKINLTTSNGKITGGTLSNYSAKTATFTKDTDGLGFKVVLTFDDAATLTYQNYNLSGTSTTTVTYVFDDISFSGYIADQTVVNNRLTLWNKIKDTNTFKAWFNNSLVGTKYYLATEYNNTYQTETAPVVLNNATTQSLKLPNPNVLGVGSDLNFIYTTTITPNTYFYGPYATPNTTSIGYQYDWNGTRGNAITLGTDTLNTNGNNNTYCSVFVTNGSPNGIAGITTPNDTVVTIRTTDDDCWLLKNVFNNASTRWECQTIKTSDYIETPDGVRQTLNYVFMKPDDGTEYSFTLGNTHVICSTTKKYKIYDANGNLKTTQNSYKYILDNYVYNQTFSYPTSIWHSSSRTGIYAKRANNGNYIDFNDMFTTRYIDYDYEDLLKLDGKLSRYTADPDYVSQDEIDIISDIFDTILLTAANKDKFMEVVAKALLETLGTTNTTNHINFINKFVENGVLTTTKIDNTTLPFDYLKYSSTLTINDYLESLAGTSDYKKKILNAASRNKTVFCELLEILFNKALTTGADTTYVPGQSLNYGGNFDVDILSQRLALIAANKSSANPSSNLPNVSGTNLATGAKIPLTVDPNSVTSANYTGSSASESVSSQNIGYYLGNLNTIEQQTINFAGTLIAPTDNNNNYTYSNGQTPKQAETTPRQMFKMLGPNGGYQGYTISALSNEEFSALPENIQNLIPNEDTSVTTSMIRLSQRYPGNVNYIANSNQDDAWSDHGEISYYDENYGSTGNGIALPNNGIWFKPKNIGTIRFVFYTGTDGKAFSLVKVNRNSATTANPFAGHDFSAGKVDFTGCGNLPEYLVVYYEYEVTPADINNNVEFWLLGGDATGAYFMYLDMGINGSEGPTQEDKTYYVQDYFNNKVSNTDNLLAYLTPLDAGNMLTSYTKDSTVDSETDLTGYYTFEEATTYDSSEEYYTKVGKNYLVAKNVNSSNVTDYYVKIAASTFSDDAEYYKARYISEYQKLSIYDPPFLLKLAKSSNAATCEYIKSINDSDNTTTVDHDALKEILVYLSKNNKIFDAIISYANTHSKLDNVLKMYITAGALATDFYTKYQTDMTKTSMYTKLNVFEEQHRWITGKNEINVDKFEKFCKYIGYELDMNYGIFALASNEGIKNGVFIPDNLDITKMDDPYSKDDTLNVITLKETDSNEWRGGDTASDSDKTTVNYAFFIDMKQLKQSISTAVFEFDINYGGATLYGDIDNNEKTVTFYVSGDTTGTGTITNAEFADKATSTKNVGGTVSNNSTFVVTAENTNVTATYTVIFKTLNVEFSLKYSDDTETKTVGIDDFNLNYTVTLTLTSATGKKLPTGLNLEPYISFVGTNTYKSTDENPLISLSSSSVDHIVDANGNATITIVVSPELPGDTYDITVSMLTASDSVEFIKNKSTQNAITKIQYQGTDVTFTDNVATTTIPFGRAFDYVELTDPSNENFYLNEFEISYNATAVLTATKEVNAKGLMTYTVTIAVRSESGAIATYTHKLVENQYFANDIYAYLYADGDQVGIPANYSALDEDLRIVNLKDGTFTYDNTKDDFTGSANSSLNDTMKMLVSFNRGHEPQYRVKYVLTNFYTLGENVVFAPTAATLANGATVNNTYAGLTVTVSNNNDTGVYTFVYTYTNKGIWNDGDYTRYYEFPELIIEKLASTDALLRKITFLEEAVSLGNTATVILPNSVLVPNKDDRSSIGYSSEDTVYNEAFKSNEREINVSHSGIEYSESAKTASDYFVIGTVSNADLSYYCPTFAIEEHAQMYQYTTLEKLMHYGAGRQTDKDKVVLTNHDTMYLYVPFRNATSKEIFLVELNNGKWTNVYSTAFNGTNGDTTLIGTFATDVTTKHHENATVEGYTVSEYAGDATNNDSLFMDYVGTPVDGHFWYVSYVIFSEDYLDGSRLAGNIRYYHISIIDLTNNIQFYVKVYAPSDFTLTDIYLTISENIYKNSESSTRQISAYAQNLNSAIYDGNRTDIKNYKLYTLRYDLQTLPQGYFYFFVDLPEGYIAKSYTSMANELDGDDYETEEAGSFLPHTSIITQKVNLEIIINKGTEIDNSAWAISTSDIYTIQANYEGTIPPEPSNN